MRFIVYTMLVLFTAAGCVKKVDNSPDNSIDLRDCEKQTYRITHLDMPNDIDESKALGLDIDGDGEVENVYGDLYSLFVRRNEVATELEERINRGIAGDEAPWLLSLWICEDSQVALMLGRDQDTNRFEIFDPDDVAEFPATGMNVDGRIIVSGGRGEVPVGLTADLAEVVVNPWGAWEGMATEVDIDSDVLSGRVGVALSPGYFLLLIPPLTATINYAATLENTATLEFFDLNSDGVVTEEELIEHFYIEATLRHPDLDMVGDNDGIADSLSFAFGIEAQRID